ncbi:MAG: ABC transporter substrate-binding protein [Bradyrhizobium sp.]|uniref:ABC transporter substrate-binding protein n=1 Tax=Bradyrhizobium sp. TaxID=376 RepID=UPI001DA57196|nr:ABC transporter substrate-binding protein [Bradyrhizobium sp.]MBV9562759.1 ABC transporter substrate-binding protein [Bradyrhizobium sp.]
MSKPEFEPSQALRRYLKWRQAVFSIAVLFAGAASADPRDNLAIAQDLAGRVGPIVGSALACRNVAGARVQVIIDKFRTAIGEASTDEAEQADVARAFDRYVAEGRSAVTNGRTDCKTADRQFSDLEQSVGASPSPEQRLANAITPSAANATTTPAQQLLPTNARGVTDREIRFGIVLPFSGAPKEAGRHMKLGIDIAFAQANDAGGVNGRMLKLIAADDGYETSRTLEAMSKLWDNDQVFGFIGNLGTPNAAVAIPFALERKALFFAPFTGGGIVRHDPPDRYVFNYRPSYTEETGAAVRYLLKIRKFRPEQIAVFAQNDAFGDSGFAGVTKTFRALGLNDGNILRVGYARNSIDVDDAVNRLRLQKVPIRAVVMTATPRAAARFIEKTRDLFPGMIYTDVSVVGVSDLAEELNLLGPRFATGVIVTQTVPPISGYSSLVLGYKTALEKYFPAEKPEDISLEGFVAATILIDAIRRCGAEVDTEKLVDILENTSNLDLGLGTSLNFNRGEHQASHKVWGLALQETGKYQPVELE